jgi:hypothetical protein
MNADEYTRHPKRLEALTFEKKPADACAKRPLQREAKSVLTAVG